MAAIRAPHMALIGPQILMWNHLAGQRISQNTNDPGEWKNKKEATLCLKSNCGRSHTAQLCQPVGGTSQECEYWEMVGIGGYLLQPNKDMNNRKYETKYIPRTLAPTFVHSTFPALPIGNHCCQSLLYLPSILFWKISENRHRLSAPKEDLLPILLCLAFSQQHTFKSSMQKSVHGRASLNSTVKLLFLSR